MVLMSVFPRSMTVGMIVIVGMNMRVADQVPAGMEMPMPVIAGPEQVQSVPTARQCCIEHREQARDTFQHRVGHGQEVDQFVQLDCITLRFCKSHQPASSLLMFFVFLDRSVHVKAGNR